jgi:hypothetical protein
MYQCINGFTKEKMKEVIRARNNGKKSTALDNPDLCLYQSAGGNHCAVGCFIPYGHKAMSFEGGVSSLFNRYPDLAAVMPLKSPDLQAMQRVHDTIADETTDMRDHLCQWIDKNVED